MSMMTKQLLRMSEQRLFEATRDTILYFGSTILNVIVVVIYELRVVLACSLLIRLHVNTLDFFTNHKT